jgi:hypothetical protein
MPRYHFHAADGAPVHDMHGSELADEAAARAEALRYAGELLQWSPELLSARNQLRISVTGEDGALLFTIVTVLVEAPRRTDGSGSLIN